MGLYVSHNAFDGSYCSFNRFRQAVAKAIGGSYPDHDPALRDRHGLPLNERWWYWGEGYNVATHPGLMAFFNSIDYGGGGLPIGILPSNCQSIAVEMEPLLPKIDELGLGAGHILRDGGYGAVARRFISGCKSAARLRQYLRFE